MSELGPESRALVDDARRGLGPDELAIRRMRARVAATIAAGAGTALATHATSAATAATATTATTTAAAAATGASLAVKVAVLAIATSAAIGAGVGVHIVRTRTAAPPAKAPVVELPASAPSSAIDRDELAPPAVVHVREVAPEPPAAPAPIAMAPKPISLARETELVDAAFAALSHGRTAEALVAIRHYADETHGSGQLAEDASAIEVEALCRLGDARGADVLAAFEARWPHAAELAKLVAACPP